MRKLAISLGVTLLLTLLVLFIVPLFVPADVYKEQIIAKVEAATGRNMSIDGSFGLRFIPRLQVTMEEVSLDNPEGFSSTGQEPMIRLQELQISLAFFKLLQGELVIERFKLVEPSIRLARNARGEANWVFTPQADADTARDKTGDTDKEHGTFRHDLQLPSLQIENGSLTYQASPDAEPIGFSQLNAHLRMPSLHRGMHLDVETRWNDAVPLKLEGNIDTPASWLEDKETAYSLTLRAGGKRLSLKAEGKAHPVAEDGRRTPTIEGEAQLTSDSLRKLGNDLGMTLLPETMKGAGKLNLRSRFHYRDPVARLDGIAVSLDDLSLNGDASLRLDGPRPSVTANLASDNIIKLDDFMPQSESAAKSPKGRDSGDASQTGEGWSTDPVMADTSALKAADADVRLAIGGLKLDRMVMGAMDIRATLNNGTLTTRVPEFAFYDGTAQAEATIRVTGKDSLAIRKDATIRNANIGAFLEDSYGFDRLAGNGELSLTFDTQGSSVRDFVERLNGNGEFHLRNGAIRGFNLAQTVREAQALVQGVQNIRNRDFTADIRPQAQDGGARTDFAELSGSAIINSGILSNRDLSLKAPLLTVTGQGTVDIPNKSVDYRLRPTLIGSIEGEGRAQQTSGELTIPVRVTGTFDTLKFTPDASGVVEEALKDPKGAVKGLEQNFRGLRDDVKSLFRGQ